MFKEQTTIRAWIRVLVRSLSLEYVSKSERKQESGERTGKRNRDPVEGCRTLRYIIS
jgi:hypothetical protein